MGYQQGVRVGDDLEYARWLLYVFNLHHSADHRGSLLRTIFLRHFVDGDSLSLTTAFHLAMLLFVTGRDSSMFCKLVFCSRSDSSHLSMPALFYCRTASVTF